MNTQIRQTLYVALATAACIAVAIVCRVVQREADVSVLLSNGLNVLRSLVYIGLFSAWGLSIYLRVTQVAARKFLMAIAFLTALWILVRAFKQLYVSDSNAIRYLWYSYYIFITLIPTLALFVSLNLGQRDGYKLPKYYYLLFIPAAILIVLAMTNDLHQIYFRFPPSTEVWGEDDYAYGVGVFLCSAWDIFCGIASIVLMFRKCRIPRTKKFLWIPIIPFILVVIYVALYALKIPFVYTIGWDLAVFESLSFVFFLESCIRCGFIQTNALYADLFATADISAQIYDENYSLKYSAREVIEYPLETIKKAEEGAILLPDGKRVNNMRIHGGRAVWVEDMKELLDLQNELLDAGEDLKDRKALLEYEYKQEEAHKIIEEQNRLYDLLQDKTQKQFDEIERLTKKYEAAPIEDKRKILAEIVVLGSYIKRRKDFVLLVDKNQKLSADPLTNAFGESFRALSLLGVKGGYAVKVDRELDGNTLTDAYDFFEKVVENVLEKAKYINVRVFEVNGFCRLAMTVDCKTTIADSRVRTEEEEDETTMVLSLEV